MTTNGVCKRYCASHDVILQVENEKFYLEKKILRERSAYFEAMFSGKFAEDSQDVVLIEMISAKSMAFILDYIFHHVFEIEDLSDISEYVQAAMFFQLHELVELVFRGLITKINYYSWAKILQIVKHFHLDSLERKVRCFGLYNFQNVRRFIGCIDNINMLHWYLSHVYLNVVNEYQVFETGCEWLNRTKTEHMGDKSILIILSCIRYQNVDLEMINKIGNHPMVESNNVAKQVIECIKQIISHNVNAECISTASYKENYFKEVPNDIYNIACGFFLSVKDRLYIEQPCVIRKRNSVFLYRFNSKIQKLEPWIDVVNKNWWGHNVVVWKGFNIIVACGEMSMGKNIWNTDILIYNILEEKWSVMNTVPSSPRRHAAALINDDLLYIIGGVNQFRVSLSSVAVYDLNNDTWSALPDLPETSQNPVATFHKEELYVSAEMLHVYRNNRWVTLFRNFMRHNTILSYKNCLYLAQNWKNSLMCWDSENVIEYFKAYEQNTKETKYNITSMCRIGKYIYFLTEPEGFEKQVYCVERCNLEVTTFHGTEMLMETVASSDYPYNTSECFAVPDIDIEDESINDFGKRWLKDESLVTNGHVNGSNTF